MTFRYATKGRRFITYLIDFVLLSIIAGHLGGFFENLFGLDSSIENSYLELALMEYVNYMGGSGSMENVFYYSQQYVLHYLINTCFNSITILFLIIIFLIIIPKFWGGKTIGRWLTRLILVDNKGHYVNTNKLILREIVGTFIFYSILGGLGIIISAFIVLAKKRSIPDLVSKTYLVFEPDMNVNSNDNNTFKSNDITDKFDDSLSVESNYKEVSNEDINNEDSEDDYKIF